MAFHKQHCEAENGTMAMSWEVPVVQLLHCCCRVPTIFWY